MKKLDITDKHLQENPFKVPEGYFDNLTKNIMSQIPEESLATESLPKQKKGIVRYLRPVLCVAAVLGGLVFGIETYRYVSSANFGAQENPSETLTAKESSTETIDDFCDYARIDQTEIYNCVTDSNAE